jgi:hypothetical protein
LLVTLLSSCPSSLHLVAGLDSCFWFVVLRSVHLVVPLTRFHQSNNKLI